MSQCMQCHRDLLLRCELACHVQLEGCQQDLARYRRKPAAKSRTGCLSRRLGAAGPQQLRGADTLQYRCHRRWAKPNFGHTLRSQLLVTLAAGPSAFMLQNLRFGDLTDVYLPSPPGGGHCLSGLPLDEGPFMLVDFRLLHCRRSQGNMLRIVRACLSVACSEPFSRPLYMGSGRCFWHPESNSTRCPRSARQGWQDEARQSEFCIWKEAQYLWTSQRRERAVLGKHFDGQLLRFLKLSGRHRPR